MPLQHTTVFIITANSPNCTKLSIILVSVNHTVCVSVFVCTMYVYTVGNYSMLQYVSFSLASVSTLYCMCVHVCYNNTSLSLHLMGWEQAAQTPCLSVSLAATDGVICC